MFSSNLLNLLHGCRFQFYRIPVVGGLVVSSHRGRSGNRRWWSTGPSQIIRDRSTGSVAGTPQDTVAVALVVRPIDARRGRQPCQNHRVAWVQLQ